MGDSGRTAGGADTAHDAVKGLLGTFFKVAALGIGDILHNVKILGAALGAGVAADTRIDFRIQLHHNLLGGRYLFDIVHLLDQGEEGQVATYMLSSTLVWQARQAFSSRSPLIR